MGFRERAAWVMAAVMTLSGAYYAYQAAQFGWSAPSMAVLIPYTILVVAASVVAQTALAMWSPKEAEAPADERERPLLDRAGNWSGWVLGAGVMAALWHYMFHRDGTVMFHLIFGALIVSQVAEYAFQIVLLRRGD